MSVRKINESYDNLSVKDERVIRDVLDYIDTTVENLSWIDTFVLGNGLNFKIDNEELEPQLTDAFIENGIFVYDTKCNKIMHDCQRHLQSIKRAISDVLNTYNS